MIHISLQKKVKQDGLSAWYIKKVNQDGGIFEISGTLFGCDSVETFIFSFFVFLGSIFRGSISCCVSFQQEGYQIK